MQIGINRLELKTRYIVNIKRKIIIKLLIEKSLYLLILGLGVILVLMLSMSNVVYEQENTTD